MKKKGLGFVFSEEEMTLYGMPKYVHQSKAPRFGAMLLELSRDKAQQMQSLFTYGVKQDVPGLRDLNEGCNEAFNMSERIFFETDPKHTAKFGIEAIERALREELNVR